MIESMLRRLNTVHCMKGRCEIVGSRFGPVLSCTCECIECGGPSSNRKTPALQAGDPGATPGGSTTDDEPEEGDEGYSRHDYGYRD